MATKTPTRRALASTPAEKAAVLDNVFAEVKVLLGKYAPPFEVRTDAKGGYSLWSTKRAVVQGRQRDEFFFSGIIPQKGYIGFYYMPVYAEPERKAMFKPELLSLLKGKSCFYLRKPDPVVMKQIKQALADGFKMYKREGWV